MKLTSGESDDNVGAVTAGGVKQKRIRYALSGASGFSIKGKSGVVVYDGSAIDAEQAQLTVTARDSKGKAESASVVITVSVAHDAPGATVVLDDPQAGGDDPAIGAVSPPARSPASRTRWRSRGAAQTPAATNSEPKFADDVAIRIVPENSPAGALVGAPLTASDSDHDSLTYSLSGSDAFRIGASSGQIAVAEGAVLDYEIQTAYTLTVGVSDGKNASGESDPSVDDTVEVVVNLSDVDETPAEPQLQEREPEVEPQPHVKTEEGEVPFHFHVVQGIYKFPDLDGSGDDDGFDFKVSPGDGHVRLSWTNPLNRHTTITKYQYSCSGGSGNAPCASASDWKDIPSGPYATGYRVRDLANYNVYTFKIRTVPIPDTSANMWTSSELTAKPTDLKITTVKLYCPGYPTPCTYKRVLPGKPTVYEGNSVDPVFRILAYRGDDETEKWTRLTWTIEDAPTGFKLTRSDDTDQGNHEDVVTFVAYDGSEWGDSESGTITVTGTDGTTTLSIKLGVYLIRR